MFRCANLDTEEGDLYFNWSDQLAGKGIAKLTVNESEREMGKLFALREINDGVTVTSSWKATQAGWENITHNIEAEIVRKLGFIFVNACAHVPWLDISIA